MNDAQNTSPPRPVSYPIPAFLLRPLFDAGGVETPSLSLARRHLIVLDDRLNSVRFVAPSL
jgi:hypothetical protein